MAATEPLVFDAIRTPRGRGKVNGSLHSTKPVDLVVGLMHEMLSRNPEFDPNRVDDVVLGCVTPIGDQGADIAKTAAIKAGLPDTVSGVQLNRFCASGLEAVNIAAQKVASGWEDLVFAGGVESMSRVPMGSDGGAWAMDPETNYDTSFIPQGIGADLIATVEEFSRDDVDAYAARSQERAATAQAEGRFCQVGRSRCSTSTTTSCSTATSSSGRARPSRRSPALKPSFAAMGEMGGFDAVALQKYHWIEKIDHVHTPGNSSGIVDGASLVAIGNEKTGAELGLRARARILATAVSGADPTIMLTGPAPASRKALAKAGLTVDDLDLVEINEAFAAVVLRFVRDMGLDMDRVNVNGGAIAMGHPLGATGAHDPGHAGRRAGAPEQALRPGHAVHRRRHGHRHRRRAHLAPRHRPLTSAPHRKERRPMTESSTIRWDQRRRRHRHPHARRPQPVGQHDERRLPASMKATVERLEAERDEITGVIITSAKKTFFAGGDLNDLKTATRENSDEVATFVRDGKAMLRRLETLGKPVVAAINGAALGGGLEIALACHHRIVVDGPQGPCSASRRSSSGCSPAPAASTRTVRMLGIVNALMQLLLQGQRLRPAKALEIGLVDEVVRTRR